MNQTETKIEIKIIDPRDIRALRLKVLWPHKETVENCSLPSDTEPGAFHVGAVQNGRVVGTSSFLVDVNPKFEEKNQYRLRAMATDPDIQGTGTGAAILARGIKELKERGVKLLWCDARLKATGFYEKLNFKVMGDIYDVPVIGPHKLMYIEL
jgi:GNAT superfamily N-acetyltransferase